MGIGSFFRDQLSRIIEWKDQPSDILVWKFPSVNDEIKNASKLIVSPGQGAILVYEGKVVDHLTEEGLFDLETDNHPFLTTLLNLRTNFESEHKLKIWFYRKAETTNQGWGSPQMIKYMDPFYKIPVELGANGSFSFVISNPLNLFTNVIGAKDAYTVAEARQLLQNRFPEQLSSVLAQRGISYQQIDAQLPALSLLIKEQLNPELNKLGFELTDFKLNGTVFDQSTKERIGRVADVTTATMAAGEGGLSYVEMEKLKALRDAARNEGGLAGAGLQVGVGMDLGKTFNAGKEETLSKKESDPVARLKMLKSLLDEGIITQEEFASKKKEWLDKL
ncbi:SPFH domain-containing protein [Pedobacter agri]|uniref:SPFH domain-containing protein n=1 Tax=Pedobacter agri TaxID=454586 RepID=UPI00292D33DC|nr:SPFH domain-containing protein [Pedobacter agri]